MTGNGVGKAEGVNERQVSALPELRAHRVGGIAKERDSTSMNPGHEDIVIFREDQLLARVDLSDQTAGVWREVKC